MSKQRSAAMGSLTAVATGTVVDCSDLEAAEVYLSGTFVATVLVEATADGTNWVQVASLTAPAITVLPPSAKLARIRCTAYTSGTAVGHLGGRDDDRPA